MVAKKTAVQQPAPSGRPGPAHGGGAREGAPAEAAARKRAKKAAGAAEEAAARTAHDGVAVATRLPAASPVKKASVKKATAGKEPADEAITRGTAAGAAPVEETSAKKPPARKATAGKTAARKAVAEGASAKKPPARKTAAGKATGRKAVAKDASAKRAPARKAAGEAAVEKASAVGKPSAAGKKGREKVAGEVPGKGAAPGAVSAESPEAGRSGSGAAGASGSVQDVAGHSTADDAGAVDAAAQTGVTTVGAKKTPGTATAAKSPVPKARIGTAGPGDLAVRPGEEPWTPEEAQEARAELTSEVLRLREEIASSEQSLAGLMRDSGDGAGDDDADTGTKNITREHELALAANAREMLSQFERALQRLDAGTYGLCENCGNPIGKARMQAFPRATLCVECKQKQERRY
jgi:RNA polymerase-binding protein DksA